MAPFDAQQTIEAARRALAARLAAAGIEASAIEARLLLSHITGLSPAGLIAEGRAPLGAAAAMLDALVARRLAGEPVARLLGAWEFYGLSFDLSPDTLVPRPETEGVVDQALAWIGDRRVDVVDIGTGSGAILVAILANAPRARGVGVDLSTGALATARANAAKAGVAERAQFVAGDLATGLHPASFDLAVSNPPYIASVVIETLARDVRDHDPRLALDGGVDGLDCYRRLIPQLFQVVKPGGRALLEIGFDQGAAVGALMRASGFTEVDVTRDLSGHDRVVGGNRP